eukprot:9478147-Pyramimonas_sp.AAC.1
MGNPPKDAFTSLPPGPILGHSRWPRPTRRASKWASKALASLLRILVMRVDTPEFFRGLGSEGSAIPSSAHRFQS